jgi:MFS family permease
MTVDAEAPYTKGERASVTLSCMLGFWLDFYNLVIVTFLFVPIEKSFGIGLAAAGTVTSVTLLGSIVGGIFFGWVGDKVGRKNALLLTLGLFSAGAIVAAAAWSYAALLVFRFIAGIGLGGEWGAGMVLLNEIWPKERRGFGTTMVQAMAPVGAASAAVVATWCLATFGPAAGWRVALLTGGAPILLMVYVRIWMPESRLWLSYHRMRRAGTLPPEKRAAKPPLLDMFEGASGRYLLLGTLAWSAYVIGFQCISVFMPTLMTQQLGAPLAVVRNVVTVSGLSGAVVMLALGWYSDRMGRKFGVVLPNLVSIVAFGALASWGGTRYGGALFAWPVFWCYLLWTFGQSSAGMYGSWLSELFVVELRASAVATVYNVGRGAGAISPIIVPLLATAFGGNLLYAMVSGVLGGVICLAAVAALPETAGRSFAVIEAKERAAWMTD